MAEPTADDTAAALAAVRRYCGWHVAPEQSETVVVDGPGSPLLMLPTLHIVDLTTVTEDGVLIDTDYLTWSQDGRVRKRQIAWWETTGQLHGYFWTSAYQGVVVTMTHGYAEAPDFDKAVSMVAESFAASGLRDDQSMTMKQVDDVRYQWSSDDVERIVGAHLLAPYRLEKTP